MYATYFDPYNPYTDGMIPYQPYVAITPKPLTNGVLVTRNGSSLGKITKISAPTKTGLTTVETFFIGALIGGIVMGAIVYGVVESGAKYASRKISKRG